MAFAEPASWRIEREAQLPDSYPELGVSDPGGVIATDGATVAGGGAPTTFSQNMLALANHATLQFDGGQDVPEPTPDAPDTTPNAVPFARPPTHGFDLSGLLSTVGGAVGKGVSDLSQIGTYLPLPQRQREDVNRFVGGLGLPGEVLNALPAFALGGGELGALRGLGGAVGSVLAPHAVNALLPQQTPEWARVAADLAASAVGGGAGIGAGALAERSWQSVARQVALEAERSAAPEAFQYGRGNINGAGELRPHAIRPEDAIPRQTYLAPGVEQAGIGGGSVFNPSPEERAAFEARTGLKAPQEAIAAANAGAQGDRFFIDAMGEAADARDRVQELTRLTALPDAELSQVMPPGYKFPENYRGQLNFQLSEAKAAQEQAEFRVTALRTDKPFDQPARFPFAGMGGGADLPPEPPPNPPAPGLAGGAEAPPEPFKAGEEVPGGMARAREAAGRPPVLGSTGVATPEQSLIDAIRQSKPLQAQNAELLSQFRSRQAGAFSGALQSGPGGEAGFNRALGAMHGEAERVAFPPLRDALDPAAQSGLFDAVTAHPDLRPFEKVQAGTALRNLLDGTVPTPSALNELEGVFPGITKALVGAKIMSGPTLLQRLPTTLADINNSIRSSNTLLDFAFMGRLGRQAGLMQPGTYARAIGQAWRSLADPEIVNTVWRNIDERAAASGGPTVEEMRSDYGLRAFNSDTAPGLLGKVPGVGRLAKVYQNFQALLRPQMLEEDIQNRLAAGSLTPADLRNPDVTQDLGRAINLLTGSSSLRIGSDANLLLEFPNWLAAQGELIFRGMQRGSITSQVARQSLLRLVAFGTATTAALNLAQGKSPVANLRNGVPMASVPGTDLTVDMFGPLGELVSKAGGIVSSTVQGEQRGGLSGAASGFGKGAFGAYRGLASPLAGLAVDQLTAKNYIGQPVSTPGQRITNLIEHVLPFNVSGALQGREPAAQALGAVGERVHQPSTTASVQQGNYAGLPPERQVQGITSEAWRMLGQAEGVPDSVKGHGSYYDWQAAERARLTPLAQAQAQSEGWHLTPPEIDQAVQQVIDADPVSNAWHEARAYLKDQWVYDHPQLALDLYAKNPQYGQPGYDADLSLTQQQLATAHALLESLQPAGAR